MAGFSPSLPIRKDEAHGFALTRSMLEVVRQNFKNLVLTNPGERIMLPDFGVGIRKFLFEMNGESTYGAIRSAISTQVDKYLPFISVKSVNFAVDEFNAPESLGVSIFYNIQPLDLTDVLELTIES
tara:strand:- start:185 stop:562 length:378 start_codon:yes stop_codon:yes gene_type:complete